MQRELPQRRQRATSARAILERLVADGKRLLQAEADPLHPLYESFDPWQLHEALEGMADASCALLGAAPTSPCPIEIPDPLTTERQPDESAVIVDSPNCSWRSGPIVKTKKSKASTATSDPLRDERYESALRWFASFRCILTRLADALELQTAAADDASIGEFLDADDVLQLYHAINEAIDRATEATPSPICPVYIPSPLPK